jgi:hypothetical protein
MLINDHDKHRVLRPIASYMAGGEIRSGTPSDCEITLQNFFLQYQLNEGTEWAVYTVTPMGPNPKVEVRDRVNIGVTFGDFNFVPDFKRVVNAVNEVVETFLPVFGPEET